MQFKNSVLKIGKLTTSEEKKNLARNENTPGDILSLLSQGNKEVRQLVASNPNTPIEVLKKLGIEFADEIVNNPVFNLLLLEDSNNNFLKMCLATSTTTSLETLEELSSDLDCDIRGQVAKNSKITGRILNRLGEDKDYYVLLSVLENRNTTEQTLYKLLNSVLSNYFTSKILKHPNASLDILLTAAEHPYSNPRIAVSKCRKTPKYLLVKLSDDYVASVRRGVAGNPRTPAEILTKLSSDNALSVIRAVARNPKTPDNLLTKLANHSNKSIRRAVAYNPKASAEILSKLANDSEQEVCMGVIKNFNTPINILNNLVKQNHYYIYSSICNDNILANIFDAQLIEKQNNYIEEKLSVYVNKKIIKIFKRKYNISNTDFLIRVISLRRNSIRRKVLINARLPKNILNDLANHPSKYIRKIVAGHPDTSPDMLAKLAQDPIEAVRKAVTENPNTPLECLRLLTKTVKNYCLRKSIKQQYIKKQDMLISILKQLAVSSDWIDRQEAAKNTNTPLIILEKLQEDSNEYVKMSAVNNVYCCLNAENIANQKSTSKLI